MELKEYLKVFKKYWLFITIAVALGVLLAYFYSRQLPTGYKNSQTFFIAPRTSQTNLEAFHAQEKARDFTDTAVAIIASTDFQSQILSPHESLTVRKLAPQVLQINTFAQDPGHSRELMTKTVSAFNDRFASNVQEIGPAQNPAYVTPPQAVYIIAGFVAGMAFAIFAISLKVYFKI